MTTPLEFMAQFMLVVSLQLYSHSTTSMASLGHVPNSLGASPQCNPSLTTHQVPGDNLDERVVLSEPAFSADSTVLGSSVIPPLKSFKLDDSMTADERAAMIKKRNAVYSKRKYYKKKLTLSRLVDQRQDFQARNEKLKKENQRLECLLLSCQEKVKVIKATGRNKATHSLYTSPLSRPLLPATLSWAAGPAGLLQPSPAAYFPQHATLFDPGLTMASSHSTNQLLHPHQMQLAAMEARKYHLDRISIREDHDLLLSMLTSRR